MERWPDCTVAQGDPLKIRSPPAVDSTIPSNKKTLQDTMVQIPIQGECKSNLKGVTTDQGIMAQGRDPTKGSSSN